MSKMHYLVTSYKFSKNRQGLGDLCPQRSLTFDFDDLKLSDLAKLWFFVVHTNYNEIKL